MQNEHAEQGQVDKLRERLRESEVRLAEIQLRLTELENALLALNKWPKLALTMPESLFQVPDEGRAFICLAMLNRVIGPWVLRDCSM
jgi:hypothetical protein